MLDHVRLQRDKTQVAKEIEETARSSDGEKARRESSAKVDQIRKDVLTVTMKVGQQIGTLTTSLEQVEKEVGEIKKKGMRPSKC